MRWSLPSAAATWTPSGRPARVEPERDLGDGEAEEVENGGGREDPGPADGRAVARRDARMRLVEQDPVVAEDGADLLAQRVRGGDGLLRARGRHMAVETLERERDQRRECVVAAARARPSVHGRGPRGCTPASSSSSLSEVARAVAQRGEVDLERAAELLERHALAARAALLQGAGGGVARLAQLLAGRQRARRRRRAGPAARSGRPPPGRRARGRRSARPRRPGRR